MNIKQYFFTMLLILIIAVNTAFAQRFVVDTIKAVVYGEDADDCALITLSDITRPGIDGMVHTLDEKVFEKLLWFDGKKHRILPSEEDIERHLKAVERENNIGRKELIQIFANGGYTFEEGREQFGVMYTVNSMIDFKVRGGLFVSQKEVEQYYHEHPEYIETSYMLKRGIVPYDYALLQNEQIKQVEHAIKNHEEISNIQWSPAFSIAENQLAQDLQSIKVLSPNDISDPVITTDGITLFKIVDITPRRLKTLDERYAQIADLLRRPKYQEILADYKVQLYDHASIVYF